MTPLPAGRLLLPTALLLAALRAHAQAPTLTGLVPARNAVAAPRASDVALTFDQAIYPASAGTVRVFSHQRGGQLVRAGGGTVIANATNTITFDPTTDFKPGETVFVTVPATVQGTGGAAAKHVHQFTAAVVGGTGDFVAPVSNAEVSVGNGPHNVAVGDVDGDGDLDLLTANTGTVGTISIRFNDGAGDFRGTQLLDVGNDLGGIAVGDVDGDGDLDLLAVSIRNNLVSVRLNDGAGTFSGTQTVRVDTGPQSVIVGDVDGDGDLDLLTANYDTNTVSVRLNDGTGTFSGLTNVVVGGNPRGVVVGDVDADGDLDLLAPTGNFNTVSIRLNDGTGTFSGTQDVGVGNIPQTLTIGDVDGDGDLDLFAANSSLFTGANGTVSVRLNDGRGVFSGTTDVVVGRVPYGVVVGDVDGDGDLDLLTSNETGSTVSVRLNDGAGSFSGLQDVEVRNRPYKLTLGDVDSDGDLDLLTVNNGENTVSVRLNNGTGPLLATAPALAARSAAFTLSPNPASTQVRLSGAGALAAIVLTDLTGRLVATATADGTGAATLPVAGLPAGVYVVRAGPQTRKLVVE